MSPELTIIIVGSLVAASCALVGSFLVLRKMALLGDAISHAVLPGIALAFLITENRSPLPMVIGAGALGVFTVFCVEVLNRTKRLREDASIGVVFPALFSIGVILISRYAGQIDLDLDCVLYGEIAYAPWDTLTFRGVELGPEAIWVTGAIFLFDLALVLLFYKELKITTFDPEMAASQGISPSFFHYLLMTAVSLTVVGSFESVGAILVVAMLIVPPATAYLLTESLAVMLGLAIAIGIGSASAGYALARAWDASIAGTMATVSGFLFLMALLFAPRSGILARILHHRRLSEALARQLLLLHLRDGDETSAMEALRERFGWTSARFERTIAPLIANGYIARAGAGLRITPSGLALTEQTGISPLAHRD